MATAKRMATFLVTTRQRDTRTALTKLIYSVVAEAGTMTDIYLVKNVGAMTDLRMNDTDALENVCFHRIYNSENLELKKNVSRISPSEECLKGDDELVKLYTGLLYIYTLLYPYDYLSICFLPC